MPRLTHPSIIPARVSAIFKTTVCVVLTSMLSAALLLSFLPQPASAGLKTDIDDMLRKTGAATELPGTGSDSTQTLQTIVGNVIKTALTLLGSIFLVLIIYGGFVWLLARGRDEEVQRAQKIIETSVIGLLVIVVAYAISRFVFDIILEVF